MKDLRITPVNKEQCGNLCCSDCKAYNKEISFQDCKRRQYLYQKGKEIIIC